MLKILITFALLCSLAYSSPLTDETRCDSSYDYKYPDGSCLAQCPDPLKILSKKGPAFYCISPCSGRYFDTWNRTCTGICKPEYVRNDSGVLYCDNPQPIHTKPCPSSLDYRYPNGSCLSSPCSYPFQKNIMTYDKICEARCSGLYLNPWAEHCMISCEDEFIRFEDGVTYCDQPNKTSNACPSSYDFRYLNGSCLESCGSPFEAVWVYGAFLCVPNCPRGSYFNFWTERCINSCDDEYIQAAVGQKFCDQPPKNLANGCPFPTDFKYPNGSCLQESCAWPLVPEEKEGSLYCNIICHGRKYYNPWNGSCHDTCRPDLIRKGNGYLTCNMDPSHHPCPNPDWWVNLDGSCSPTCPSPYSLSSKYAYFVCHNFPCPAGKNIYSNGSCIETCDSEGFAISVEKGTVYCRETAKIEIYLRYDIPLKDFNAGGYRAKFIALMAKLLDVSSSDIKIISLKEGSTIIESEVVLGTKSKANLINQKLTEAAESKSFNLEGVGVLNHKFSIVIPESGTENDDIDDKSSSKAIAIGLGVGLAVGIVTLVVYLRYRKKQKLFKVREQIQGKAKTVAETPARRDEEIRSFVHRETVQPEADQVSPRMKVEPEQKEDEHAENEGPLSMDEIMKNIDENL